MSDIWTVWQKNH